MWSFCSIDPQFLGGSFRTPQISKTWTEVHVTLWLHRRGAHFCCDGGGSSCPEAQRGSAPSRPALAEPTWECPARGFRPGGALPLTSHIGTCRREHTGPGFEKDTIWFLNAVSSTRLQIKCGNFVAVGLIQLLCRTQFDVQSKGVRAHPPGSLHQRWRRGQRGRWSAGQVSFCISEAGQARRDQYGQVWQRAEWRS